MSYQSLLVTVDDSWENIGVPGTAAALAARFDGELTGLYIREPISSRDPRASKAGSSGFSPQQCADDENTIGKRLRAEFDQICRAYGVNRFESRCVAGERLAALCLHARYADVVLLSQADEVQAEGLLKPDPNLAAQVAMVSARPVIAVPPGDRVENLGQRVLLAWNGSPQATRAVAAALPLLRDAERVIIIAVNPETDGRDQGPEPGADIALYLARHGIDVESIRLEHNAPSVTQALIACADWMDADLICMGAYGHSRLRELVLGGVTRDLPYEIGVPVSMVH